MPTETESEKGVDFSSLILGLSSAALSYLGLEANGDANSQSRNLMLARQNIDIIELLRQKTQGNLSQSESALLQEVLTDLRMRFVSCCK